MTRPRPIGPALAGAIDLSALKQPPPSPAAADSAAAVPGAVEVTEANFEAEVLARSNQVPVVVLLWTPRSPSSVQLAEVFAALAAQDGGTWAFARVNVDVVPQIAQAFGVQGVPTVVALAAGQPLSSFQGAQPPDELRRWVDSLLEATAGKLASGEEGEPEAVDPEVERARALIDAGDFDGALAAYQAILESTPNDEEAKGAVRRLTFEKRAGSHPEDAVARADAAPDDVAAAFAAADVEVQQWNLAAGFNRLIALVKRTAGDDRTAVRTRLIELFELFDPADPDVVAGRRNLANALY
ncbi:tetratricopeptide repeat protein [Mycolicibacterium sediminis]|uniref:Thioredoxin domain-containing protein n=1 Tax=Mycolicibacterium sediminis TaxID=1286180 RepID=A0A7I7QXR9_9MYCO|nr:tetratricopeptide repeat protein [Mycolicibacterium sediminis]BBY31085.1 hypothetical protein MSEDJ_51810 [Mycolicibacterium sediminis]